MPGQRIALPPYSMFASTPVYEVDGPAIVFGLMKPVITPDPTDELWPVTAVGAYRFDLMADAYYGSVNLWWVIASVNNILDPLQGAQPGTFLRIPTKNRLAAAGILNV